MSGLELKIATLSVAWLFLGLAPVPKLDVKQGLVQVGDYVFHVFDADGEAH